MGIHDNTIQELMNIQAGRMGSTLITDTVAHVGTFAELVALTPCVITAATGNCVGLTGATIPAGMSVAGMFTSITLTSGTMIAYTGV